MQQQTWSFPNNIPEKLAESAKRIINAALNEVDPCKVVIDNAGIIDDSVWVGNGHDQIYFPAGRIKVAAFGKAALAMVIGLENAIGQSIKNGIFITKHEQSDLTLPGGKYTIHVGSHPLPDEKSLNAARAVLAFLNECEKEDVIIFLISGGGSSLLCLPENPLSLEDIQAVTSTLLACGASIQEMNIVRKHLDSVKGGKLATAATGCRQVSLIFSDVVDNSLSAIASGPTVPDGSTFGDAEGVLTKHKVWEKIPGNVREFILDGVSGKRPETVKADHPVFKIASALIIASNRDAMLAAGRQAGLEGFTVMLDEYPFTGEASLLGHELVQKARKMQQNAIKSGRPACVIFGGESTVTLTGLGIGGRNLETALGAVPALAEGKHEYLVTLATDGEDGPTDAAGACVSSDTLQVIVDQHQLDIDFAQQNNDSYPILEKTGSLIKTGPTGTNVNDLVLWFYYPET